MFQKLVGVVGELLGWRDARRLLENQATHIGADAIRREWTQNHALIRDFSPELVRSEGELMMTRIIEVVESADPRISNRAAIADHVVEFARLHVLTVPPEPEPDTNTLRGRYGITGELKAHLIELSQKDDYLRVFMSRFEKETGFAQIWNVVALEWRKRNAWMRVFSAMRVAYNDWSRDPGKDWFWPYVEAICGCQEYNYRLGLGLPPSLAPSPVDASLRYLALGVFGHYVQQGVENPYMEWRQQLANQIPREWIDTKASADKP